MKMMKKILASIVGLVLALTLARTLSVTAWAQVGPPGGPGPQAGPGAQVWNTKYHPGRGPHGPPFGPAPTTQMTVTAERAKELAQKFLNVFLPGTTVDSAVDTFYGFYDLFVLKGVRRSLIPDPRFSKIRQ